MCVCACLRESKRDRDSKVIYFFELIDLNIYLSLKSSFQVDLQVVVTVGGTGVEEDGDKRTKQDTTKEIMKKDRGREEDTQEVILSLILVLIRTSTKEIL